MKEFKCDECDKVYKHKQSLHRHKKQVHISENKKEIVEKTEENHNTNITKRQNLQKKMVHQKDVSIFCCKIGTTFATSFVVKKL